MLSTLGQSFVLIALLICAIGAPLAFMAGASHSSTGLRTSRRLALGFAISMAAATLIMEIALVRHDFSVSYVAKVGSLATPLHITIVSLWSSLDGSILFWGLVLAGFTAAVAVIHRDELHDDYLAYTLGTLFAIGIFFSALIAGPANPFAPTPLPIPTDGPGPNPLLQNHLLMIIHPPMLYLGYVGMSVPFAMAIAALLAGRLGPTWLRPLRNWLLVPTGFLSAGIMLGGWWSYEVLGWGGYWAWDPVENASFLPWLTGVAALHSAVVQQRRGTLKGWTVILIMISFLLTILGTFLTRSGVVNSVHSFTQSPIGPLFLLFLGICSVAVVVILALRIDTLSSGSSDDTPLAREGAFLLNNLLLVAFMFTVLVGTLYPILAEAVRGTKVSVGEPYFNRMAIPIGLGLLLMMGIGPALPWGRASKEKIRRALLLPLPAAALAVAVCYAVGGRAWSVLFTSALGGYALFVTIDQLTRPSRSRAKKEESPLRAFGSTLRRAPRHYGAYLVHLGVVVTFLAIAISSTYQTSNERLLATGQTMEVGSYSVTVEEVFVDRKPHLSAQKARLQIARNGKDLGQLSPALNHYPTQREPLGAPAVRTSLTHDLYLTLMSVQQNGTVGIRAIVTPAVVWIWIGVAIMVAGTALCLVPARSPAPRTATATS